MAARLRPFVLPSVSTLPLEVKDVLDFPAFSGARVVAGTAGVVRHVRRVNVMQIPTAGFARAGELVLTTTTAFETAPAALERLIDELAGRDVAALAAHRQALGRIGDRGLAVAEERGLPLIELPQHARLNVVLREVLAGLVAEQTTQLEEDRRVRELLVDFALGGSGVGDLPAAIGELTGGEVAIVDEAGHVLASSDGAREAHATQLARAWLGGGWDAPADAGRSWVVWPIRGGGRRLGCLVASIPGARQPMHRAVLEHGSTGAALGILQLQAARAEATRLREQFIHDLLGGSFEPDAVRERAELLGWDPDDPYRVLLARHDHHEPGRLVGQARATAAGALAVEHSDACLIIVGSERGSNRAGADAAVDSIAYELSTLDEGVRIGVSRVHTGMARLAAAAREAAEMLAAATTFRSQRVRWFDAMDPLRLLALVPRDELVAFCDHVLQAFDALDDERRETLLETLEALIENDLNAAATARRGGWHYNTVRYRIQRLTELAGPFVESGERLQSLSLALLIRRELSGGTARVPASAPY